MQYTSKYNVNALWFVRWVLLQYTSKYNFNALWFLRWLQFAAANADSGIPSIATNEPLREASATFRFVATDADSKTPSFATNEVSPMGSEVTLPSPVHRDMLSHPFKPNRESGIPVMGLDICGAHLSPSAASHKGWETIGETAGKRPPCKLTATVYLQCWCRGSPRQRDPSNMETRIPRKRIHPSDADTAGREATPELAGNDSDYGGEHHPPCSCTDLDDSGLLGAPCPICGHLFFTNIR
jgi:hypothetical protein